MKFLVDQNLSRRLAASLSRLFPGTEHVRHFGLERADDAEIWAFARENGFTILTKDDDFRQMSFVLGHPPKVVWLRLGNCSAEQVGAAILGQARAIQAFEEDEDASFLILSSGA